MATALTWSIARAGGIVAWALVFTSVVWGLVLSTRSFRSRWRPAWVLDLHRFVGGLALVFTGIHVVALMADRYVDFGLTDVLVPFAASWRSSAVAWGVVGFWLLAAVEITSLLRRHIPKRIWQRVHLASFVLFIASTQHALAAGTDASLPLVRAAAFVAIVTVAGLASLRTAAPARVPTSGRESSPSPAPATPTRVG